MIGKTRVGKSALINAIAGEEIAREGHNTTDITRDVTTYDFSLEGIKYVVWEAPGLQDTTESDSSVITKLKKKLQRECSHINLVIYCTLMNRERFEQSEVEAIHHITEAFTIKIWSKAVFVLTYANRVLPEAGCETNEDAVIWFRSRVNEFKTVIQQALVGSGVSSEDAADVAIIPSGYYKASPWDPNANVFYGITDWVSQFWIHCENKINETPFMIEFEELAGQNNLPFASDTGKTLRSFHMN